MEGEVMFMKSCVNHICRAFELGHGMATNKYVDS